MSVFNYLVSRARSITHAGNPAERSKDANGKELKEEKPLALTWRDLSSSFSPPLCPPDILSGAPFPIQPGHLAEKRPPSSPRVLGLGDIKDFHPLGCPQTSLCVFLSTGHSLVAIQLAQQTPRVSFGCPSWDAHWLLMMFVVCTWSRPHVWLQHGQSSALKS